MGVLDKVRRRRRTSQLTKIANENAARGATLLDHMMDEGWRDRIDAHRLDIGSTRDCVLGQLFFESAPYAYSDGLDALGIDVRTETGHGIATLHGFETIGVEGVPSLVDQDEYEALLNDAWRELITRDKTPIATAVG